MTKCLNCGNTFEGDFCPHCGQKATTKRLKIKEIVMDTVNSFVGGDNKFMRTCRDLCTRPGYMVCEFLVGHRAKYYNPLQVYIYTVTLYAILSYIMGVSSSFLDNIVDVNLDEKDSEYASIGIIFEYLKTIYSNKLYGTLLTASISAISCRIVFRKYKLLRSDGMMLPLNTTEQFYTQLYESCIDMIIAIFLLPFCFIPIIESHTKLIYEISSIAVSIILYKQLLGIGWVKSTILNIIATAITFIIFVILLLLAIGGCAGIEEAMK